MSATSRSDAGQHKRNDDQVRKDFKFIRDNFYTLLARYPNQWIAVRGEQVAASASDYSQAETQLKQQGITPNDVLWEFMDEDKNYQIASNWDSAIEEWQIARMLSRFRDD